MSFAILYDNQPTKFLGKLEKLIAKRIIEKLDVTLNSQPVPQGAIPIVGEHGVFRIRIGDYRVIYRINYPEQKIIIVKIGKQSNVYN